MTVITQHFELTLLRDEHAIELLTVSPPCLWPLVSFSPEPVFGRHSLTMTYSIFFEDYLNILQEINTDPCISIENKVT